MPRVRDQCHRVRHKPKAALDEHENQVEGHREAHAKVDTLGSYRVRMAVIVVMPMFMSGRVLMRVRTVIFILHRVCGPSTPGNLDPVKRTPPQYIKIQGNGELADFRPR